MIKGKINKILINSSVDGPGNRGVVFLQGCNINCIYCHNPETINHCINCGVCVSPCPVGALTNDKGIVKWNSEICVNCDTCIKVCPHNSSPKIMEFTAEETMEFLKPYFDFMRGITVSGGECTLQQHYVKELFILAKKNSLHTLIDTNGTTDINDSLLDVTDGIMIDIKDYKNPLKITGNPLSDLHNNFTRFLNLGKIHEIRHVMMEGVTETIETIDYITETVKNNKDIPLKLIRFRPYGTRIKDVPACTLEYAEKMKYYAKEKGMQNVIIT